MFGSRNEPLSHKVNSPKETATPSLASAALHALKWRYAGAVLQGGLQFTVGVVLARLLSPEAFGIVGMALIATGFGRLVGDFGFGAAVIQYPHLTQRHVRAALTGTMVLCVLFFLVLWFLAPTISHLFAQDGLVPILRVIGISLIFSGMSVTVVSLFRRNLQFKKLTAIENFSYVAGFGVVGISMAFLGYGPWSLVAANIVQPFCLLVLGLYFIKQPLWLCFSLQEYRDLFRVASAEVLNNVVNFSAENLQFVVIGKWLGASALGLYNRSYHLKDLPVKYFSLALASVTFPVYAKIQGDIPRLGRAFLRTVSFTALVTVPVFVAIATVPEIILGGLFGEQWKPAAGALRVLCLSGPLVAMMRVFGSVTHARGYVFNECARQTVYLGFMGLSVWFLLPLGLEGVASAVAIAAVARYLLLAHLSLALAGVRWKQFAVAQVPGYLLGIITSASAYLASTMGSALGMSDILQVVIVVPICALSLLLSLFLFPSTWFGDLYVWFVARFGMNFPHRIRRLLMPDVSAL
jgi:O-antigen/teichoic acid export membrane protein